MLKIRLQRVGRKNDASFRVVVTESQRGPKAGNNIEVLGFYDPKRDISELKADRVTYWMGVGAQVSGTVHNLLVSKGIVKGKKVNVLPKKSPIIDEEALKKAEEEAAAKAEAEKAAKEAEAAPVAEAADDSSNEEDTLKETAEEPAPEAEPKEEEVTAQAEVAKEAAK